MGVISTYRSLSAEQKKIVKDKQLNINRPVDEILGLLYPVAKCDQVASKGGKFGCLAGLALPLMVVDLMLTSNDVIPKIAGQAIFVLLVAAMIAFFMLWRWTRSIDVSDNLGGFTLPMLALFREDFDGGKPVHVRLDMRAATHKDKLQSKGDPYKSGVYQKVIDSIFKDEWFAGEAQLADGSRLRWSATDIIRQRQKTKRNARGKYKSKTKYRKVTTFDVALTLKKKRYAVAAATDQRVDEGENAHTVRLRRRVRTDSLNPVELRPFVDAVADIYRNAKPLK